MILFDIDIDRHDSLWAFLERKLQHFVQLKIKLDKKQPRFAEANFQEANWPSWEMYLLDTDLNSLQNRSPVFFFRVFVKERNTYQHESYKYQISPLQHGLSPLWWTPWQWCRWAAGTAGGYTACAALRPEEVDKSILTWPNICENSGQLPGFVLWSSHHHCERLPKMQFAKCCWRLNLRQKSSYSISSNKQSHETSNLYDVFAFTSCISEEGRPEDLHLEAFELLTVAEPSTPSTSWLSSQEAGWCECIVVIGPFPKKQMTQWPSHYRLLPGCQQIESLVPTLLRLLLSRWDREDFCLGKPMMLLIRWVEAWWGYWWMLPEWWLSFSLFANIIKHIFWKHCASSFFGISCYLV